MDGLCGGVTKACECSSIFFRFIGTFNGVVCNIFSAFCFFKDSIKRYIYVYYYTILYNKNKTLL